MLVPLCWCDSATLCHCVTALGVNVLLLLCHCVAVTVSLSCYYSGSAVVSLCCCHSATLCHCVAVTGVTVLLS